MALSEFVESVRIGAGFLSPEVWADSAYQPSEKISRALQLADIWLTPAVVNGFSESDFVSLTVEDRARLREAVEGFRAIASCVNSSGPASQDQVDQALPHFLTILDIVRPYIANKEALAVRRAVWSACEKYQDWIPSFDFKLDWDSVGDPGVWVWLILNDDVDVMTRGVQLQLSEVRRTIRSELSKAGIASALYASVWKRKEVAPVVLGGVAA